MEPGGRRARLRPVRRCARRARHPSATGPRQRPGTTYRHPEHAGPAEQHERTTPPPGTLILSILAATGPLMLFALIDVGSPDAAGSSITSSPRRPPVDDGPTEADIAVMQRSATWFAPGPGRARATFALARSRAELCKAARSEALSRAWRVSDQLQSTVRLVRRKTQGRTPGGRPSVMSTTTWEPFRWLTCRTTPTPGRPRANKLTETVGRR